MYIELHARSAFSFLEGASVPEELAEVCAAYQMPAMALLDRDGVYGAPRFHLAMKKHLICTIKHEHLYFPVMEEWAWGALIFTMRKEALI